jgi:hypothetical protein
LVASNPAVPASAALCLVHRSFHQGNPVPIAGNDPACSPANLLFMNSGISEKRSGRKFLLKFLLGRIGLVNSTNRKARFPNEGESGLLD